MLTLTINEVRANRKAWIAALRGGKYKQTHEFLRQGDKFNFMGVACDASNVGYWEKDRKADYYTYNVWPSETARTLPAAVREWLDIKPDLKGDLLMSKLMLMNNRGASFNELADVIEKSLPSKTPSRRKKEC